MQANRTGRIYDARLSAKRFSTITPREARADLQQLWKFLAPQYMVRHEELAWRQKASGHAVTTKDIMACDSLLLLGSNDANTIAIASHLFKTNRGLRIVCSGKVGHRTVPSQPYTSAEADVNARELMALGVPFERILIEPESDNTGSNIINSRIMLIARGLPAKRVIIVQSPAAQLRANLCFEKKWGEDYDWEFYISHPPIPLSPTSKEVKDLAFHLSYALREVTRTINYSYNPDFDYQTKRPIPGFVLSIIAKYLPAVNKDYVKFTAGSLYKDPRLMQSLMDSFGSLFEAVDKDCPA